MDEMIGRAFRAYFMTAARAGYSADQPSASDSCVEHHDDKSYVVLRNGYSVLAVYRVRNDGMLKRLRRWPANLETHLAPAE
jgi:hypothetical protein